jgi:CSLREA domain-containing protein
MSRASFLRRLFNPARRPGSKPARRSRLVVEPLEDRAVPALITVTSLADNTTADGHVTLREALQAASSDASVDGSTAGSGTDTITFAPSLFAGGVQTINLTGELPTLNTDLTIDGPGADLLTVRRDTGGSYRLFTVYPSRTVTLQDLTLANGYDPDGGGAIRTYGTLTVANCAFVNNSDFQSLDGGAIKAGAGEGLTIRNCTFSGNTTSAGGHGAAVYSQIPTTITNSTFSGNTSASPNAGTVFLRGSFTLVNNTFSGNDGGGLSLSDATNVTLSNNILANSTNGSDLYAFRSTLNGSNNLIETTNLLSTTDNLTGTLTADPQLGPLADNGGPTLTFALLPGSPAINAGTSTGAPPTDQRGAGRSDAVDIGAYEYSLVVDTTGDETDGINAGKVSLRDAIAAATANPGADTITFAPSLFTGGG